MESGVEQAFDCVCYCVSLSIYIKPTEDMRFFQYMANVMAALRHHHQSNPIEKKSLKI